jgi:hypothetical protein
MLGGREIAWFEFDHLNAVVAMPVRCEQPLGDVKA